MIRMNVKPLKKKKVKKNDLTEEQQDIKDYLGIEF
jgi:hypothetical protein